MNSRVSIIICLTWITALPAQAHTGIHASHDLLQGMLHPFLGLDHLLVMLSIGIGAALQNKRAMWLLPVCCISFMAIGASIALTHITVSSLETWLAISALCSGLLVWSQWNTTYTISMLCTGYVAVCHGYVHAIEIPQQTELLTYITGLLLSTAVLQAIGMGLGLLGIAKNKHFSTGFGLLCLSVGYSLLAGV